MGPPPGRGAVLSSRGALRRGHAQRGESRRPAHGHTRACAPFAQCQDPADRETRRPAERAGALAEQKPSAAGVRTRAPRHGPASFTNADRGKTQAGFTILGI